MPLHHRIIHFEVILHFSLVAEGCDMHLFNCSTELFFEYDKIFWKQWMVTHTNMKHELKWYAHLLLAASELSFVAVNLHWYLRYRWIRLVWFSSSSLRLSSILILSSSNGICWPGGGILTYPLILLHVWLLDGTSCSSYHSIFYVLQHQPHN